MNQSLQVGVRLISESDLYASIYGTFCDNEWNQKAQSTDVFTASFSLEYANQQPLLLLQINVLKSANNNGTVW